ncbi:YxlC family protein [Fredinandcohnia sp. QZ13]|uniref:YxlC family protein n=1 Tax=Fredinandcohnia sp. QZ13 TaxID=3073144 RepID=UPI0028532EB4|nr:YxlC family protein [Fredinandcohnia sp. QZ13]MDR4887243.1 YxlC family protein [Fredinandcohnia sp. QZ13]
MKKNKLVLLKNEPQHEEDVETIQEINEALTKIDQQYSVFTPDLQVFEQLVAAEQQKQKKKFRRDLIAFILIALFMTTALITAFFQLPLAYILIQGIATISFPVYSFYRYRKRVMRT